MEQRIKSIAYKIEFNNCLYDFIQYFDNTNSIIADELYADGFPIPASNYAIRHKICDFIKENKLTYI